MINFKKELFVFLIALIPTIIFIQLMIYYFPFTGLARVISVPGTYFTNSIIIVAAIIISREKGKRRNNKILLNSLIWIIVVVINIMIVIKGHPQEFGPSPWEKIHNSISAINKYEALEMKDMDRIIEFSKLDDSDAEEIYVVSLYKFQDEIPFDEGYQVYRFHERGIEDYENYIIKDLKEIKNHLSRFDRLIWSYLEVRY